MSLKVIGEEINEIKSINKQTAFFNKNLKDLSNLKTYSIDDKNTKEIDDAISLERVSNVLKLWIHIASPPSNIEYDSTLDKNARKLISTVYLSEKTIYMFPERLINEVFSLNINEKRPSISLGVVMDNDGNVTSSEIVRSLIKLNYQLSYEEADELIEYAPKEEEDLFIISKILEKRKLRRKKLGAKEILESYGKIIVKDKVPNIRLIDPTLSRILVSEAMILYGDLISKFTLKNNISVPYRVQDSNTKIAKTNLYNSNCEILYNFKLKKSMGKTYYSSNPQKHNGLGLKSYLHATSPIRRYSDLLVHYQLHRFFDKRDLISEEEIKLNIDKINNLGRQNVYRYRDDQKIWLKEWFKINSSNLYNVILLNWVNRYKNICILYFLEYNISTICFLKTKIEITPSDKAQIKNITDNYDELLYFELIR